MLFRSRDVCRALIPYSNLEVSFLLKPYDNEVPCTGISFKKNLLEELNNNKELLNNGDKDDNDCSGSDSSHSEDDLPISILKQVIPYIQ